MKKTDKIAVAAFVVFLLLVLYYFLFPNRDWSGKPYLETAKNDGFAVVELFTSEGCSSCPPADELMAKMEKESKGKNIYFLAYHVDYWDHMDWKDRFSSPGYTERQRQYSLRMGQNLVYTPQFIVNGTAEFGGDDERTLYSLLSDALKVKPTLKLELNTAKTENNIGVNFKTNTVDSGSSLLVALVQKEAETDVRGGENEGESLHHVQIVRDITANTLNKKEGIVEILKPSYFNSVQWELIGFIQNNTTGVITAATKVEFK